MLCNTKVHLNNNITILKSDHNQEMCVIVDEWRIIEHNKLVKIAKSAALSTSSQPLSAFATLSENTRNVVSHICQRTRGLGSPF